MSQKSKHTIAETWQEKIDRPLPKYKDIDHDAVRKMKGAAEDVLHETSPRYNDLFVFSDGSGIYEKRPDDWFVSSPEEVTELMENH
jgi:hypothetical protein